MKDFIQHKLREGLITEGKESVNRVVKLLNSLEFKNEVLNAGGEIYAVGGIVRDALMGKNSDDLDIVVRGIPYDKLFKILSRYGKATDTSVGGNVLHVIDLNTGEDSIKVTDKVDFGATKFVSKSDTFNKMLDDNGMVRDIDVMLPRKDAKDPNIKGHRGIKSDVNPNYTIEDDLERRDITINAIALGLNGEIIDKNGQGQKDIKNGVIRAVSEDAFIEDPLRMLRAIRFSSRFDYDMDPKTLKLIKNNVKLLSDKGELPAERFLMEFKKMIGKADLSRAVKQLVDLGMYKAIFGVEPKIDDYAKFSKAKNLGEFAYMMFEGQPPKLIVGLIRENITNASDVLNYVDALVKYIHLVKGKTLDMVKELNALAEIYKKSPSMLIDSIYVDKEHKDIAEKFRTGELPKGPNDVAFKGDEFFKFVKEIILQTAGRFIQADGRKMGVAKNLALQAIYGQEIPNEVEAIKNFLLQTKEKWLQ